MLLVFPLVMDMKVLPLVGEPPDCQEKPTKVSVKLLVLELGIQLTFNSLLPELVKEVIITEPNSTKKSTKSEKLSTLILRLENLSKTMPLLTLILLIKLLPQWVVSLTTVKLKTIMLWLKEDVLVPKSVFS